MQTTNYKGIQWREILKKEFFVSGYLPLSVYVMANMVEPFEYGNVVRKSKDIYQRMKKEHPFLTSGEDSGFAVMFAISDLSVDTAIIKIEECYNLLHKKFLSANAVQALSHTLALGEEDTEKKCNKVI